MGKTDIDLGVFFFVFFSGSIAFVCHFTQVLTWTFSLRHPQLHADTHMLSLVTFKWLCVSLCRASAPSQAKHRIIYSSVFPPSFALLVKERVSTWFLQPILYVHYYSFINIQCYFSARELPHTMQYIKCCYIKNWPRFSFFMYTLISSQHFLSGFGFVNLL